MSLSLESASAPWSSSSVLTVVGTSLPGSSLDQELDDVLAPAHGACNRRTGVQNSSDEYGGMGRKESIV